MKSSCRFIAPVVLLTLSVPLLATVMKQTVTAIAVPKDTAAIPLRDLVYKASFTTEVKTVRLDRMPADATEPAEADWVFTGSNSDGQIHRLSVTITLADEGGIKVASFDSKTMLRPGAKDQSFSVHMKVPAKAWAAARTIRIAVDWTS